MPTVVRRYPGYVHGFMHALTIGRGSWEALAEMGGVLRLALSQPVPVVQAGEAPGDVVALESA